MTEFNFRIAGWKTRKNGRYYDAQRPYGTLNLYKNDAGDCPLTIRVSRYRCVIRLWGNPDIAKGFTLNGNTFTQDEIKESKGGFKVRTNLSIGNLTTPAGYETPKPEPEPEPKKTEVVKPKSKPKAQYETKSFGAVKVMTEVIKRLMPLNKTVRFFGNSASDAYIQTLTRESLAQFLLQDKTDNLKYIKNSETVTGFDCENFAETLRVDAAKQKINSCGVIWGDGHAFNFFIIHDNTHLSIIFVEPQTDQIIQELIGAHSITNRCEVLL